MPIVSGKWYAWVVGLSNWSTGKKEEKKRKEKEMREM
jgi:hypothetical protein